MMQDKKVWLVKRCPHCGTQMKIQALEEQLRRFNNGKVYSIRPWVHSPDFNLVECCRVLIDERIYKLKQAPSEDAGLECIINVRCGGCLWRHSVSSFVQLIEV